MNYKNLKIAIFFLFILFTISFVGAISSSEAIAFVQNESHFLNASESAEIFPDGFISLQGKQYWVAAIVSNDSVKGFIAVEKEKKAVVSSNAINRELFKTAFIARSIVSYKADLGKRGKEWFFSSSNATFIGNLSRFLASESFELTTIKKELSDQTALSTIDSMNLLLEKMSNESADLKTSINDAISFESNFLAQPDANQSEKLKQKYDAVFDSITALEQDAISYDAKVTQLNQFISESELDVGIKQNLINLAKPPEGFYNIGNWSLESADLKQGINSFYSQANSGIALWLDNLQNRIKMNSSWFLLYGEDKDLLEKTGKSFSSLKQGYDYVFSDTVRDKWIAQDKLNELNSDWSKAVNAFNTGAFDSVQTISVKVRNEIVAIYSAGFVPDTSPDYSTIALEIVGGLVILLIIMSFLKRKKNSEFEEDDGYGEGEGSY